MTKNDTRIAAPPPRVSALCAADLSRDGFAITGAANEARPPTPSSHILVNVEKYATPGFTDVRYRLKPNDPIVTAMSRSGMRRVRRIGASLAATTPASISSGRAT